MISLIYFFFGVVVGIVSTIVALVLSYESYQKKKGEKKE